MQIHDKHTIIHAAKAADTYTLLNCLKAGVLLLGQHSEILFCNQAALNILALSEKDLDDLKNGCFKLDIIREDGSAILPESYPSAQVRDSLVPVENLVAGVFRDALKDRVWLQLNATPVHGVDGNLERVIVSFTDITEHKEAKDKLTALYQHLELRAFEIATANADMEKFVYAATHDLQEPLRLISSFVQLLENKYSGQLDDQARQYIRFAVDGSKRMKKLIMDLLEYSRFSGSGMILTATDINSLLEKIRRSMSVQLEAAGAIVHTGAMPVVQVNPALLNQLFENLIDNALKYRSGEQPVIDISCTETPGYWQFCVKDNGIGISQSHSERVFDLFHRLNTSGSYDGTGVGLAICQKIVRLHRGNIWVVSQPGEGSSFYFTIPSVIIRPYEKI